MTRVLATNGSSTERIAAQRGGTALSRAATPGCVLRHDDALIALVGHPRWSGAAPARAITEVAVRIVDGYRALGAAVPASLHGDFAFALIDSRAGTALLAVDRIGVQSLAYAQLGHGGLLAASTLDAIAACPGVDTRLDEQALYDFLYFHVIPGPRTVYRSMLRVPAGHSVHIVDGQPVVAPYWQMRFEEPADADAAQLGARFIEVVRQATIDAADGARCGSFLSGGTDSSTITGMLRQTQDGPVKSFSIGFEADGYDEMAYARIAARRFGVDHVEHYVTPAQVCEAVPRIAAHYDQPFGNASAVPTYFCAQVAREHGVSRLLAGDGGDELFGGNARYAKQHVFALYDRLPAALRGGLLEALARREGAGARAADRLLPLRKLRSYVRQASQPMPERYESYNLLEHIGAARVLDAALLSRTSPTQPHELLRDVHAAYRDLSLINQMLGIDLKFTLADSDLPKVTRMCALAGVDVAFPMLDDTVVGLSAGLPPSFKLKGNRLRPFFKEALGGFLPREVLTKEKHGFGLPVGAWLSSHAPLNTLARDAAQQVAARGLVQRPFIDELFGPLLRAHPAYYGTMAWLLMMLGLWLQSRGR